MYAVNVVSLDAAAVTDVALSAFKSYDAVHGDVAVGNGAVDRVAVATSITLLLCLM